MERETRIVGEAIQRSVSLLSVLKGSEVVEEWRSRGVEVKLQIYNLRHLQRSTQQVRRALVTCTDGAALYSLDPPKGGIVKKVKYVKKRKVGVQQVV